MIENLRIERGVYGGSGLARTADGATVFVPFALPGEQVEAGRAEAGNEAHLREVVEASPYRVAAPCPHFGPCGGCQYQMATYPEQLRLKRAILEETLVRAGVRSSPSIFMHSAEPWGYRNRIRLRVARRGGQIRFGYNQRASNRFLPITTCPIAAPILWSTAAALLAAASNPGIAAWLDATAEVELFCNPGQTRVQLSLLMPGAAPVPATFARSIQGLNPPRLAGALPQLAGAAAVQVNARTGRVIRTLAETGAAGLAYRVAVPHAEPAATDETYWIPRGGFFQVNRFLIETLLELVCTREGQLRSGSLAWDLFAGVGLFSRVLARRFARVTAVEANPIAAAELRTALARLSPDSTALECTTIDFLRSAVLQRDRPELIVLDPPRAGAGVESCELLLRLAPREIVYVSCDPATLARDLNLLQRQYRIATLHLVDLFPQTFHLESVVILERNS